MLDNWNQARLQVCLRGDKFLHGEGVIKDGTVGSGSLHS